MSTSSHTARLFTIRLWRAAPKAALAPEWRGKVQSLPDGEAYYFRNWSGLIQYLEAMLDRGEAKGNATPNRDKGKEQ